MEGNELGPEGGAAIAEALKVNETVVDIKFVPSCRVCPAATASPLVTDGVTPCHAFPCSLQSNKLGPEGGRAIAEALKVNETVTTIKCVPHSPFSVRPRSVAIATRLRLLPTG